MKITKQQIINSLALFPIHENFTLSFMDNKKKFNMYDIVIQEKSTFKNTVIFSEKLLIDIHNFISNDLDLAIQNFIDEKIKIGNEINILEDTENELLTEDEYIKGNYFIFNNHAYSKDKFVLTIENEVIAFNDPFCSFCEYYQKWTCDPVTVRLNETTQVTYSRDAIIDSLCIYQNEEYFTKDYAHEVEIKKTIIVDDFSDWLGCDELTENEKNNNDTEKNKSLPHFDFIVLNQKAIKNEDQKTKLVLDCLNILGDFNLEKLGTINCLSITTDTKDLLVSPNRYENRNKTLMVETTKPSNKYKSNSFDVSLRQVDQVLGNINKISVGYFHPTNSKLDKFTVIYGEQDLAINNTYIPQKVKKDIKSISQKRLSVIGNQTSKTVDSLGNEYSLMFDTNNLVKIILNGNVLGNYGKWSILSNNSYQWLYHTYNGFINDKDRGVTLNLIKTLLNKKNISQLKTVLCNPRSNVDSYTFQDDTLTIYRQNSYAVFQKDLVENNILSVIPCDQSIDDCQNKIEQSSIELKTKIHNLINGYDSIVLKNKKEYVVVDEVKKLKMNKVSEIKKVLGINDYKKMLDNPTDLTFCTDTITAKYDHTEIDLQILDLNSQKNKVRENIKNSDLLTEIENIHNQKIKILNERKVNCAFTNDQLNKIRDLNKQLLNLDNLRENLLNRELEKLDLKIDKLEAQKLEVITIKKQDKDLINSQIEKLSSELLIIQNKLDNVPTMLNAFSEIVHSLAMGIKTTAINQQLVNYFGSNYKTSTKVNKRITRVDNEGIVSKISNSKIIKTVKYNLNKLITNGLTVENNIVSLKKINESHEIPTDFIIKLCLDNISNASGIPYIMSRESLPDFITSNNRYLQSYGLYLTTT